MATNAETLVVVTDANVLINLIRIGQLPLLGQLDGYRFLVPTEVANEITEPDQREALSEALAGGGTLTATGTPAVNVGGGSYNMISIGANGNQTLTISTPNATDNFAINAPLQNGQQGSKTGAPLTANQIPHRSRIVRHVPVHEFSSRLIHHAHTHGSS